MKKILQRSEQNKILAGVCSGLADYFSVDVSWVRAAFLLALFAGCSGGLIYVILWIAVPINPVGSGNFEPVFEEQSGTDASFQNELKKEKRRGGRVLFGVFLIALGIFFLLDEFDIIPPWLDLGKLWPLFIIVPGILMIAKSSKKDCCNKNDGNMPKDESQTGLN